MASLVFALLFTSFVSSFSLPPSDKQGIRRQELTNLNALLNTKIEGDLPRHAPALIVQTLEKYVPYAGLSYCPDHSVKEMSCGHCRNTSAEFVAFVSHEDSGTHAVILVDEQRKEVIVSFRGSEDPAKAFTLASTTLDPYPISGNNKTRVQQIVKRYLDTIMHQIVSRLRCIFKPRNDFVLVLTGHSLGGCLATVAAPILHQKLHLTSSRLLMVTYGQPKVGNKEFVDYFNGLDFPFMRVVNGDDKLTLFPFSLKFSHFRNMIYIKENRPLLCKDDTDYRCQLPFFGSLAAHSRVGDKIIGSEGC